METLKLWFISSVMHTNAHIPQINYQRLKLCQKQMHLNQLLFTSSCAFLIRMRILCRRVKDQMQENLMPFLFCEQLLFEMI